MSSSSSRSNGSSGSSNLSKRPIDPITRTALRYTLSPREYELLHNYLISRAPQRVQKRTPKPDRYEKITKSSTESEDYNASSVRAALRVYVGLFTVLKSMDFVLAKVAQRRGVVATAKPGPKYKNTRIALSFSAMLFFHRILHRFFIRLRNELKSENAEPFRTRNPRISQALASKFTPAIGASLAGFCLGATPAEQLRVTIAVYVFSRSLEYGYNHASSSGLIWAKGKDRPWWFGSWLIMPFACAQLLHAFVFDRECFPDSMGAFILKRSPEYIQLRPKDYPIGRSWPGTFDIVDGLAEVSKLKWPAFVSPILFPNSTQTLPGGAAMQRLAPISAPAHPGTKHTSCAFLHPKDPSCARNFLRYWLSAFPPVLKFFTLIYGAFALLAYKALLKNPSPVLNRVSKRIIKMSLFITGAIGTSWGSICLFNNTLPRSFLPTQRWALGGLMGGMWAYVARDAERDNFMYSFRLSLDSFYKVGKKRGWWRGVKNGDVLLFVASLAAINCIYESRPGAVQGAVIRKALGMFRGEGWVDRASKKEGKKIREEGIAEELEREADEKKRD
ncbi:putative transmembrane protein [Septoria linicola]|nr:putative transmembrane protein [Septoria linicola]